MKNNGTVSSPSPAALKTIFTIPITVASFGFIVNIYDLMLLIVGVVTSLRRGHQKTGFYIFLYKSDHLR